MSWFFLRAGANIPEALPSLLPAQYELKTDDLHILAGGPSMTCLFHTSEDGSGFLVCGVGLIDDGKSVRSMSTADWVKWLQTENNDVSALGGHFACVKWARDGLEFFNDALGIREIFVDATEERLTLSTHLHPIAQSRSTNTLNTSSFGGKWYLHIPSDHGSPIKGIERLGPSGKGSFSKRDGLKISRRPATYDYQASSHTRIVDDVASTIARYTLFPIKKGSRTTLALSGGVDSRLILAALNGHPRDQWDAFTFGNDKDADVRVAEMLSKKLDFRLSVIAPSYIVHDDAADFVIETDTFKPISAAYSHLSYRDLTPGVIIDGAPGELLRRRLFTKLEHFGAGSVASRNWTDVTKYLWSERPNIWCDELAASLQAKAREQVVLLGESLPSSTEIGIGNWIDTMFCRLWFANTHGAEQRRLDSFVRATSPFTQPSMLRDVFHASERSRKSGKLAKDVLLKLDKRVAQYPYAKDEVIFPSWTPWYLAKLYGKLAKKRSPVLTDQTRFLQQFKVPILDTLNSKAVRECALYDQKRLHTNINAYYNGVQEHAAFVEWWYSFEIWRNANRVTDWS